jgi:hypothetical protein
MNTMQRSVSNFLTSESRRTREVFAARRAKQFGASSVAYSQLMSGRDAQTLTEVYRVLLLSERLHVLVSNDRQLRTRNRYRDVMRFSIGISRLTITKACFNCFAFHSTHLRWPFAESFEKQSCAQLS